VLVLVLVPVPLPPLPDPVPVLVPVALVPVPVPLAPDVSLPPAPPLGISGWEQKMSEKPLSASIPAGTKQLHGERKFMGR
jgi:hypothetical protein